MDEQPTDGPWTLPQGPPRPPVGGYVQEPSTGSGGDGNKVERGPNRFVLAAVIVAVIAGLGFAVYNVAGSAGGASSPEEAVDQLFQAVDDEDVLGVLAALPASEREVLQPGIEDLHAELERLGIVSEFDLDAVPGFDLQLDDYQLEATELAEDVSVVRVDGGTLFAKSVPDDYPIGETLRSILEDDFEEDPDDFEPAASAETFGDFELVAVDEDGWHVSIGYSIAEAARGDAPVPEFGNGPAPVGADTPEGAVEALVEAGTDLDAEAAITLLDPREMGALYDYAPLFLDDAEDAADDAAEELEFTVDDLEVEATGSGDTRRVLIGGFTMSYEDEYESGEISWDGECYSWDLTYEEDVYWEYDYEYEDELEGIAGDGDSGEVCAGDEPDLDDELFLGGEALPTFPASTTLAITVVERDGRWFVSPVRTVLDTAVEGLRLLEPGDIEDLGEWLSEFFGDSYDYDEEFEEIGEAIPAEPYPGDECYEVFDQYYDDTSMPYERAEYLGERDFRACLEELLAAGEIDDLDDFSPYDDECWAAYDALPADATEDQWVAADAEVRACQEGNFEGLPEDVLPEDVDTALLDGIQRCLTPEVVGWETYQYIGPLTEPGELTPGLRLGFVAFRDCLLDLDPALSCLDTLEPLSDTLPAEDFAAALGAFSECADLS